MKEEEHAQKTFKSIAFQSVKERILLPVLRHAMDLGLFWRDDLRNMVVACALP